MGRGRHHGNHRSPYLSSFKFHSPRLLFPLSLLLNLDDLLIVECRLCFAMCMWNEKDPILKERLSGVTGPEGNHGEDVKEEYFYLRSTPTHSYLKGLYKYPIAQYPYSQ